MGNNRIDSHPQVRDTGIPIQIMLHINDGHRFRIHLISRIIAIQISNVGRDAHVMVHDSWSVLCFNIGITTKTNQLAIGHIVGINNFGGDHIVSRI